jgi:hypothetical protein
MEPGRLKTTSVQLSVAAFSPRREGSELPGTRGELSCFEGSGFFRKKRDFRNPRAFS